MAPDYDAVLKLLLQASAFHALQLLLGDAVVRWVNQEVPEPRRLRADLVGETADGGIVHLEIQSTNSPQMGIRMLSYYGTISQKYGRYPRQFVIYVGREKLRMTGLLESPAVRFTYDILDLRTVDGGPFLHSDAIENQMLAVLMRLDDQRSAVRRILASIGKLDGDRRTEAIAQFLLISGLRDLQADIQEELQQMPIEESLLDHWAFGPPYRRGLEEGFANGLETGRKEGIEQGIEQGYTSGERRLFRRQLLRRFGNLPGWAEERLDTASVAQLEDWGERLLDARSLADILGHE